MGRKRKFEEPSKVVSIRLPISFLNKKPAELENGDWIAEILKVNINDLPKSEGLSTEQKEIIEFFYNFFSELFENGSLDDYILPDRAKYNEKIIEMAGKFRGVVNG